MEIGKPGYDNTVKMGKLNQMKINKNKQEVYNFDLGL